MPIQQNIDSVTGLPVKPPSYIRDIITHSPDITKLLAEVEAKMPEYLIRSEPTAAALKANPKALGKPIGFRLVKTPTMRRGNETLSVVRCTADEVKLLASLKSITVLADANYEEDPFALLSANGKKIIKRIVCQSVTTTMPDGTTVTTTPDMRFGGFAK